MLINLKTKALAMLRNFLEFFYGIFVTLLDVKMERRMTKNNFAMTIGFILNGKLISHLQFVLW